MNITKDDIILTGKILKLVFSGFLNLNNKLHYCFGEGKEKRCLTKEDIKTILKENNHDHEKC